MDKILIIGSKGQLGRELMVSAPDGIDIVGLDKEELDITVESDVFSCIGKIAPSVIVNCSAYTDVEQAELDPDAAFRVNCIGVMNLARVCKEMGIWLIHISTDYVFDGKKKGTPYLESDYVNPVNSYGRSKLAGELVIQSYLSNFTIIRTSGLYSRWGARGKGSNFPLKIMSLAKERGVVKVVNDVITSPTYALDLSEFIWNNILKEKKTGLLHVVNSGSVSWYDFACYLLSCSRIDARVIPVSSNEFPTRAKRPGWSVLASEKGVVLRPWKDAVEGFLKELGDV